MDDKVKCDTHGYTATTFVCEHLANHANDHWFSAEPTPVDPWPDAWCGDCQKVFEKYGEWSDAASDEARLVAKISCSDCYEVKKSECEVTYV